MPTLNEQRRVRLGLEALRNGLRPSADHGRNLPGVSTAGVKEILAREASRPLRGPAADLEHDSLFGDARLQRGLF